MQVMTYDMGTSPGHRRGGLIFCILRGLSSPPHRHISRYLTTAYEKKESSVKIMVIDYYNDLDNSYVKNDESTAKND